MPNFLSEDDIEQAMLQRLQHVHGYDVQDCYTTDPANLNDGSGRSDKREVILLGRLREAAIRLNPAIPEATIEHSGRTGRRWPYRRKRQGFGVCSGSQQSPNDVECGGRLQ